MYTDKNSNRFLPSVSIGAPSVAKYLLFRLIALTLLLLPAATHAKESMPATTQSNVEQWGVFEASFPGPAAGNPFVDITLQARFTSGPTSITIRGFYDGAGTYRIRFMPPTVGNWHYATQSNDRTLNARTGDFVAIPPAPNNHGPVTVHDTWHFAYADGTRFTPIGTTCYSWTQQSDELEQQTLATLAASPFNKVRMLILPVRVAPRGFPYARDAAGKFDPMRFDPAFFQHIEQRIAQLRDQNIQADLILFHPYPKGELSWFDDLDDAADERYLGYVIARFAAYRNVWWSLANEYGQVKNKSDADFDRFFQCVQQEDPYNHLRSIHNAQRYYDSNKPWVSHASIQNGMAVADFGRASLYRDVIRKPVVYDEVCYEGNSQARWGQLTGQQMVERFWLGTIAGTYVGHGETFRSPQGSSWTSTGGQLLGESPPRIAFLEKVLESAPGDIEPIDQFYETQIGGVAGQFYLVYFGSETPARWTFAIPRDPSHKQALAEGMQFHVDVLDTWNMTITFTAKPVILAPLAGSVYRAAEGRVIDLPSKPFIALRIRRLLGDATRLSP